MDLYKIKSSRIETLREKKFSLERELQQLVEKNINQIFGLQFVQSEFALNGLRLDTLAFDPENNAFVIIEFKRDKSLSIVDQGFAYLSLMLSNPEAFIVEYNESLGKNLRRKEVDWTQSRVVFIAQSFTIHQINAINFKGLPIELWEAKLFDENILLFNQVKANTRSQSIDLLTKDESVRKVTKSIKKSELDDYFGKEWDKTRELYKAFIERLFEQYPDLKENYQRHYIGYKIGNYNVISIKIQQQGIKLTLNRHRPKDLKDPEKRLKYKENSMEQYHQYMSVMHITDEDDIQYAMSLIRQVYDDFVRG